MVSLYFFLSRYSPNKPTPSKYHGNINVLQKIVFQKNLHKKKQNTTKIKVENTKLIHFLQKKCYLGYYFQQLQPNVGQKCLTFKAFFHFSKIDGVIRSSITLNILLLIVQKFLAL